MAPPRPAPAAPLVAAADAARRAGRFEEAAAGYERALAVDPGDVRAHLGKQWAALERGRDLDLRREYRALGDGYLSGRLEGDPARREKGFRAASEPWRSIGLAALAFDEGEPRDAERLLRRVVAADPGNLAARLALARTLQAEGRLGQAARMFESVRWTDPLHPAAPQGLSGIADRRGDLREACRLAREAYRRAPADLGLLERVEETALRTGDRREYQRAAEALLAPESREGAAAAAAAARLFERAGDPTRAAAARAKSRPGEDAAAAAGEPAPAASARGGTREFEGFLRALAAGVDARYRHFAATGEQETLEEFLEWTHRLYERVTSRRIGPPARPQDYPFVGRLVDPTEKSPEPLVAEARRLGFLMILGQRRGGPPEAMVGRIARREPPGPVRVRGHAVEREVVWLDRRWCSGYAEWAGEGDLAGLALERLVVLDLDALARWEESIRRRLRRMEPERDAILAAEPLDDAPPTAMTDPAGVADRLFLSGPLDLGSEVAVHEDAHLVDALLHLPVGKHAFRNLALVFRRRFSAESVLAYLERNAQLAAIAEGPLPLQALAVCCAALGERGAHGTGYTEIVEGFVRRIAARPGEYPRIAAGRPILQQLHRLRAEEARSIARSLAADWGVSRSAGG